jgi:uncharacterized membrane protein
VIGEIFFYHVDAFLSAHEFENKIEYIVSGDFNMKRKYTIDIFISIVIGAVFWGTAFRNTHLNPYHEVLIGAAAGMFISWFIAAAIRENDNLNQNIGAPNKAQAE